MDVLRDRIKAGSVVATDKAAAYVDVLAELDVATHVAYESKDRSKGAINRINTVHSLLGAFMEPCPRDVQRRPAVYGLLGPAA